MPSDQREQYESLKWQEKRWREESKMADDQGRSQNAFDLYKNSKAIFDNYLPYITNQPSSELQPWFGKDYFNNFLFSNQDTGWSFSPYQQAEPDQTSLRKEELYNMLAMAMEERKQIGTYSDPNLVQLASNASYIPFTSPQLFSGLDNYQDMGGYSYPEPSFQPAAPELPNDNIDGWDVSHMINPNIPWYVTPSYSSPQSDSASQQQPSAIDVAGSAISTAYNIMSFGSTLQDVLTGRRGDPGAYLSLANGAAQGLSWIYNTDGVKEITKAIGDLKDPLDTVADVTGGAVAGWGLYQNIAGLASGDVTAQNVLGVASNASQIFNSVNKLAPDLVKEVIPGAITDAMGGIGNMAGGALSAIGLVQGIEGLIEGKSQSPMDILGMAKAA
jgi:hypothetical protein